MVLNLYSGFPTLNWKQMKNGLSGLHSEPISMTVIESTKLWIKFIWECSMLLGRLVVTQKTDSGFHNTHLVVNAFIHSTNTYQTPSVW